MANSFQSKVLTAEIRKLSQAAHDWSVEDGSITKAEAFARLLWRMALGWVEEKTDDEGKVTKTPHPPSTWAMDRILERMEGKAPQSVEEHIQPITAAEQVSELSRQRVGAAAARAREQAEPPPSYPGRDEDDDDVPQE